MAAASRRLGEELGFTTGLEKLFDFTYRSEFDNGLTEFEFDHVFVGNYDREISPNAEEVSDYCYRSLDKIKEDLEARPDHFTSWFHLAFPLVTAHMTSDPAAGATHKD